MSYFGLWTMMTPLIAFLSNSKGHEEDDFIRWMVHQPLQRIVFYQTMMLGGFGLLTSGLFLHAVPG